MATTDKATAKALADARAEAVQLAKKRQVELKARAKAVAAEAADLALAAADAEQPFIASPALIAAAGGAGTKGWIIAEGDSWFDYPGADILSLIVRDGYEVESVAHAGDRVEMMAFGGDQLNKFSAAVEKVIRNGHIPRAILLSGGGNDIAGNEFGMLLNHVNATTPGLNDSIVRGVIDERCREAYLRIIMKITTLCQQKLGRKVKILVHGYAYAVPDGRGFLGGWWFLPGPWLEPGFRDKGYAMLSVRQPLMNKLIDRFNAMVKGVAALPEFEHHVRYVDLRNVVPQQPNHKQWWANELHPTDKGFKAVASRFLDVIQGP